MTIATKMIEKPHIMMELCDAIGFCSGGLASIFKDDYQFQWKDRDNVVLENFGFILAFLCVKKTLSYDEAGECIACFIGANVGNDKEKAVFIAKSAQFYLKHLQALEDDSKKTFWISSIITYNLAKPGTWDGFEEVLPLHQSMITVAERWISLQAFLYEEMPKHLMPIFQKL